MTIIKKNYVVIIGLPIQILFLSVPNYAQGEPIYSSFDIRFEEGLRCYNSAKFNIAMGIFTKLSSEYPTCSKCNYYAGKSTGKRMTLGECAGENVRERSVSECNSTIVQTGDKVRDRFTVVGNRRSMEASSHRFGKVYADLHGIGEDEPPGISL